MFFASTGKIILSAVTPVFDEKDTVVGVVGIDVKFGHSHEYDGELYDRCKWIFHAVDK